MNQIEINDFIERLTATDRANLMAGLKRINRQRTASDALSTADLLVSQLDILGLKQFAEDVEHIKVHIHKLT